MTTTLIIIFVILMLPGIAGVFLPIVPGIPYIFLVALIYGVVDKFRHLSAYEIVVLAAIAILSVVVDYLSGVLGAKWGGAARKSLSFGLLGMIIGLVAFPPFGSIIGLFLGVLIAEISSHQNGRRAVKAATGSLIGTVAGMGINFLLAILLIVLFVIFVK